MVSLLVLTLVIGKEAEALYDLSSNSLQAYACKIGADFACIHQDQYFGSDIPVHYNKLRIGDYLEIYDRVLYLDCDLIVKPNTPNIFDLVPPNAIGVMNESDCIDYSQEIQDVKSALGEIASWQQDYFNSGVMVVSKVHRQLFETPKQIFLSKFYEQSYLNWKCHILNYEIKYLPKDFNYVFSGKNLNIPESAYIVHFAGWGFDLPKAQDSDKFTYKYHQMQCFLDYLEGKRTFRIHPEQLSLESGFISKEAGLKKLIIPPNTNSLISYGPYTSIEKGLYKISINFQCISSFINNITNKDKCILFKFDIVTNNGNKCWYQGEVYRDSKLAITLELEHTKDLEFRFFGIGNEVEINYVELNLISI